MKTFRTLIILGFFLSFFPVNAQIEEIFSARDDAQTYLNHYMSPVMDGLMYNLNNGWYTTGKTHSKWGFDLTITASIAMIPDEDKSFVFNAAEYNYLTLNGTNNILPTVAGGETLATLTATKDGESIDFDALNGLGEDWPKDFFIPVSVPTPMVQVGLGLPSKTDVKLRYVPNATYKELEYGLMGVGIQHDLTQHFKFLESIPTFHLSALAAFTNTRLNYTPTNSKVEGENQHLEMGINAYTLQLIGDINLKLVNFYLGLGITNGKTTLNALGTYKFDFDGNNSYDTNEIIVDPLKMNFAINGVRTTAGMRLNLGPVKLFADYTLQKYPSVAAGLALSVR